MGAVSGVETGQWRTQPRNIQKYTENPILTGHNPCALTHTHTHSHCLHPEPLAWTAQKSIFGGGISDFWRAATESESMKLSETGWWVERRLGHNASGSILMLILTPFVSVNVKKSTRYRTCELLTGPDQHVSVLKPTLMSLRVPDVPQMLKTRWKNASNQQNHNHRMYNWRFLEVKVWFFLAEIKDCKCIWAFAGCSVTLLFIKMFWNVTFL